MRRLITIPDLIDIFGASQATVYRWRKKEGGLDKHALVVIPGRKRDVIRYDLDGILTWAKKNNVQTPGLKDWKKQVPEQLRV